MIGSMPGADDLILDGSKIKWYPDRIAAWERGERIAPITVDMSLLPRKNCNFNCSYCYAEVAGQHNVGPGIDRRTIMDFLDDAAEIGVKGVSFVSDGESSHHPDFADAIVHGRQAGLDMAVGSNALVVGPEMAARIIPHLTYFRINISAGEPKRYAEIMGVKEAWFERVCQNILGMVEVKRETGAACTIGMQMVLQPAYADQILPLSKLAVRLGVDYLVVKHCSDDEFGHIGVDYDGYEAIYPLLRQVEAMSTPATRIAIKWSKIGDKGKRSYQRCYGPPFIIQLSGTGLVAPCGMLFNDRYKDKYHIGNIATTRFKDIWQSERYWEVMRLLASPAFDAQKNCGSLCLQHVTNTALAQHRKGEINLLDEAPGPLPLHGSFI